MDNGKFENYANNQHGIVQGDRNIVTQNFYQNLSKPDFFEPNLEQFDSSKLTLPKSKIICELIEVIHAHKLLVLNGSLDVDKATIARHLAWRFTQTIQQQVRNISVKEWYRSSDPQSIDVALQQTTTTTVFLLTDILPQNISYDFFKIQKAASLYKHYVIATTNIPFAAWKQTENCKVFWREISAENLYNVEALITELKIKLLETQITLPNFVNLSIESIASKLKTPDNIDRFVQLLAAENQKTQSSKKELQETEILRLSDLTQNNYELLKQWYFNGLTRREQILILNLAFFDGLFDNQLFAALERVTEEVWKQREPFLYAPDYLDLDNLSNFFSFVNTKDGSKKIESRLPHQRQMLFKILWQSYRRGLLAILPTIIGLIKESVKQTSFKENLYDIRLQRELFFPPIKRQRLRQTLSEAISDIGLIDSSEIIETLVELSAHEDMGVQAVAASAMARWYYYNQEQQLLDTISKLQSYKYVKLSDNKSLDSQANILATIALTISYVIEYDYPKEISRSFYDLIENLSNNSSLIVRKRFFYQILPKLVPLYLFQLKDILRNLVKDALSIRIIVKRLGEAYKSKPKEVLKILDLWYQDCTNNRLPIDTNNKISQEEALLRTIVLTYKEIQLSDSFSAPVNQEVLSQLIRIISNSEKNYPFVRKIALKAIGQQIKHDFQQLEPNWLLSLLHLTADELKQVIEVLPKELKHLLNHYTTTRDNHISDDIPKTKPETSKGIDNNTVIPDDKTDIQFLQERNEPINNTISFNPPIEDVPPQQNSGLNINRTSEQQILSPNDDIPELQTTNNGILSNSDANESFSQNNEDLPTPANNNVNLDQQQANPEAVPISDTNTNLSKNLITRLRENLSRLISKNIGLIGLLSLSLIGLSILGIFVWRNPQNQANNQPSTETSSAIPESNSNSVTPSPQSRSIPNFQRTQNVARLGWIILGTTNSSRRGIFIGNPLTQNQSLLTIEPPVVPAIGSVVNITKRVNLRINRPQRPRFNAEEQPQVGVLTPGQKVVIVKIESFVEPNNPSVTKVWAEVGQQAR